MTEQEKRQKVIKHKAKMNSYFLCMILSIIVTVLIVYSTPSDGIFFIFQFVMVMICPMVALCFKILHQGMLYCPFRGSTFGYGSWMTATMPYTCPHCGERLNY